MKYCHIFLWIFLLFNLALTKRSNQIKNFKNKYFLSKLFPKLNQTEACTVCKFVIQQIARECPEIAASEYIHPPSSPPPPLDPSFLSRWTQLYKARKKLLEEHKKPFEHKEDEYYYIIHPDHLKNYVTMKDGREEEEGGEGGGENEKGRKKVELNITLNSTTEIKAKGGEGGGGGGKGKDEERRRISYEENEPDGYFKVLHEFKNVSRKDGGAMVKEEVKKKEEGRKKNGGVENNKVEGKGEKKEEREVEKKENEIGKARLKEINNENLKLMNNLFRGPSRFLQKNIEKLPSNYPNQKQKTTSWSTKEWRKGPYQVDQRKLDQVFNPSTRHYPLPLPLLFPFPFLLPLPPSLPPFPTPPPHHDLFDLERYPSFYRYNSHPDKLNYFPSSFSYESPLQGSFIIDKNIRKNEYQPHSLLLTPSPLQIHNNQPFIAQARFIETGETEKIKEGGEGGGGVRGGREEKGGNDDIKMWREKGLGKMMFGGKDAFARFIQKEAKTETKLFSNDVNHKKIPNEIHRYTPSSFSSPSSLDESLLPLLSPSSLSSSTPSSSSSPSSSSFLSYSSLLPSSPSLQISTDTLRSFVRSSPLKFTGYGSSLLPPHPEDLWPEGCCESEPCLSKPKCEEEEEVLFLEPPKVYGVSFIEIGNGTEVKIGRVRTFDFETGRRTRRIRTLPDPAWDCLEKNVDELSHFICEQEVSKSYMGYCEPILKQKDNIIEGFLYHDSTFEICQNLHMCEF